MTSKLKVSIATVAILCCADGVSAVTASAESQEERQACIGDAFKFCLSAIPDRNSVFICLTDHRNLISTACQIALAPYVSVDQTSPKDNANQRTLSNK